MFPVASHVLFASNLKKQKQKKTGAKKSCSEEVQEEAVQLVAVNYLIILMT